jgi:hypothetical protein
MIRTLQKINPADTSPSEYAALSLLGIGMAAGLAFASSHMGIPRGLHILAWIAVVFFLLLSLTRAFSKALSSKNWPSLLFSALLLFCIYQSAVKPTATGFSRHDEIYSWGMWAVQHFLGQPYDTYYTQAAYPQLFSYELSSVFLAQGSHISHFLAKLACGIPAILICIVLFDFTAKSSRQLINWLTLLLSTAAIFSLGNLLYWAYADPVASALLLTSFALLLQYSKHPGNLRPLLLSVSCGLLASLAKQPGLVWCLFTLPALVAYGTWRWRWKAAGLAVCILAMAGAAIWPLFIAPGFTGNHGVLDIARNNGGLLASVFLSIQKYVVKTPGVGILLLASFLISFFSSRGRIFWAICVAPYLLIWFTVGSYELRHGIHVVFISVALANHLLIQKHPQNTPSSTFSEDSISRGFKIPNAVIASITAAILGSSIYLAYQKNALALQDGNQAIFVSQFGKDSLSIYDDIVDHQRRIFVISNYQYGMFYNRTMIGRPDIHPAPPTAQTLLDQLIRFQPDYLLDAGEWTYGPYSPHLKALAARCSSAFTVLKQNTVQPYSAIYRIDGQALKTDCSIALERAQAQDSPAHPGPQASPAPDADTAR